MSITTISQPPAVHTAFNPTTLELRATAGEQNTTITLLYSITGIQTLYYQRDFKNNTTIFNISDLVKDLFQDTQKTIIPDVFTDYNLYVRYHLPRTSGWYSAINAVAQLGETPDLSTQRSTFRTRLQRLSHYEGYPLTATILGNKPTSNQPESNPAPPITIKYNDEPIGAIPVEYFTVNIQPGKQYIALEADFDYLQSNNGAYIYTNDGEIIQVPLGDDKVERRLLIDNKCTPQNPFYIRWINQQGGWEYFMFSHRQLIKRNIKNQRTFSPTIWDSKTASAYEKSIYKEGEEKITVGATGLSQAEFDSVSRMPYSPQIHYYDKQKNRWFDLIITDAESEENTRNNTHSVEYTFQLPVPQLQF